MFNIDKKKFGAFVAVLRKEKGITQKELSEQLSECRQTPVLRQAKLGFVLKKGKTSDIIQEKRSGYLSLHTHFAYFFRFMAANLSFTQFVT